MKSIYNKEDVAIVREWSDFPANTLLKNTENGDIVLKTPQHFTIPLISEPQVAIILHTEEFISSFSYSLKAAEGYKWTILSAEESVTLYN